MPSLLPTFRLTFGCIGLGLLAACKASQPPTAAELSAELPAGTPYAVLHLYRPGRVAGFAIGYDVRLNDTVVYRARNGSQGEVHRLKPGPVLLLAKTEAREELTVDLQPGREYFVRCALGAGVLVGRPYLQQVRVSEGRRQLADLAKSRANAAAVDGQ